MGKPAWFDSSVYNWTPSMGHDIGDWAPETQANVQQQWWRSPRWGGHLIWNPNWGFQDLSQVQNFYRNWDAGTTPKFHQAFKAAGFQKQLSDAGNWSQYYGDRPVVGNQQAQAAPPTWGQPPAAPPTTPAYGSTTETGRGFYAPQYGSSVGQYKTGRGTGRYGYDMDKAGTASTSGRSNQTPGNYYGTTKKNTTSMRYGYKPSM